MMHFQRINPHVQITRKQSEEYELRELGRYDRQQSHIKSGLPQVNHVLQEAASARWRRSHENSRFPNFRTSFHRLVRIRRVIVHLCIGEQGLWDIDEVVLEFVDSFEVIVEVLCEGFVQRAPGFRLVRKFHPLLSVFLDVVVVIT